MKQGQFPEVIQLGDLNGQNGFKLDGENNNDRSGISVSKVGDINDDGIADLLIGAYGYNNSTGRSYVVFGGAGLGSGGTVALSNLNGANGFKLDGENNKDWSGYFVNQAGDINGDGIPDLLIGAWGYPSANHKGRSYVVFGGAGVGSNGTIALSSLSGANGFKLDGENDGDYSGTSVSSAGDINGDGIDDLLIGAPNYPGGSLKGCSYVVFGGADVGSNGTLSLSSLTGANGFKINGENSQDYSGFLSRAGDINDDGIGDLLIGAYRYPGGSAKGRSYVIFGGAGVGSSGAVALSNLTGANGFKLDGENNNDRSGYSAGEAGDVNGDGIVDILIGAPYYPSNNGNGRSYVVFGGAGVGSNGTIALSSLTGVNGFKLDGENNNDVSGYSVSAAGDINGDGIEDMLIGAPFYPNGSNKGRSYVVFGGAHIGKNGPLALSDLNGANGFKLDGENINDYSGWSVSGVGDLNGDEIADLLISAPYYPSNNGTGRSYVVFGDVPPVLVNNRLSLSVGAAITLNSTFLSAYDRNHNNNTLVFIPGAVEHGQFEAVGTPGISLSNFTQQQVTDETIQFVHDGSLVAPSYDITVRSDGIAWTGPVSAKISFVGTPPSYFPAVFPLTNLNGQNGFKLDGENNGDYSGVSVSTAGDINGDGYADLLIGAYGYPIASRKGRSYVVFGGSGVGSTGTVLLSSLNGSTGFKLDGENNGDWSGYSISAAGDVNGDGYADLLIGAYGYSTNKGRSYVVFGGSGVGSTGTVLLSSLNGSTGFKLDGENNGDRSGVSVSAAGDINGDGYTDLVIGAVNYPSGNQKGRSYVVFGDAGVGGTGTVLLSSINGSNGFNWMGKIIMMRVVFP